MRIGNPIVFAALSVLAVAGQAQARPGCPEHPKTLAAMHNCYRPLLVFAPSAADARLKRQQAALDASADDMMDRDMLFVPVLADAKAFSAPLDAPYTLLPGPELNAIRKTFHIADGTFAVILLGEDGGAKLRESKPVPIEWLNQLIDSMPTRQREMLQPDTN